MTQEIFAPDMDLFDSEGSNKSVQNEPSVVSPRPSRSREPSVSATSSAGRDPPAPFIECCTGKGLHFVALPAVLDSTLYSKRSDFVR